MLASSVLARRMAFWVALPQQLLRRFERRTLGAETVLAGIGRNARGPKRVH
jgi:hypothetical protein